MDNKIPYGLQNGELVHISQVERGLACDCTCPSCGSPLVARKGDKVTHHFAHYKTDECEHAGQTTLHLLAKDILARHGTMVLPSLNWKHPIFGNIELQAARTITFDRVELERRLGHIIPDVIGYYRDVPLLIEIKVTHGVDDNKLEEIQRLGVSSVEIDLSKMRMQGDAFEKLPEIILGESHLKRWLFNRHLDRLKGEFLRYIGQGVEKLPVSRSGLVRKCKYSDHWEAANWEAASVIYHCRQCRFNLGEEYRTTKWWLWCGISGAISRDALSARKRCFSRAQYAAEDS